MDLYGDDRKLSELNEELNDFLDQDSFTPASSDSGCGMDTYVSSGMDEDWLDSFFEDPVLNDRMISDALQPPHIQCEHSYSLSNSDSAPGSPINLCKNDLEEDMLTCDTTSTSTLNLTLTSVCDSQCIKQETEERTPTPTPRETAELTATATPTASIDSTQMVTVTRTTQAHTVLKQPTIILATQSSLNSHQQTHTKHDRLVLPKVSIKVEPQELSPEHYASYHTLDLPPTPPSSSPSDSEGSQSPSRSAPSSPIRHSSLRQTVRTTVSHSTLFSSPIPQSGILMLSEEEKRTLVSEGYPIPNKLPLSKQEEKNLKKIRRKIKNKISAQESRRKKKEYLETLEKRVEVYNQENVDLKKKLESLENNNRSLMSQLQKLQSIVSKVTKPASGQNTCLMVLVLCFAVFLGSWSPTNFGIGYSRTGSTPPAIKLPMGPAVKDVSVDAYATTNIRSRVLLSLKDESDEDPYGPATPCSYRQMLVSLFHGSGGLSEDAAVVAAVPALPAAVREGPANTMELALDPLDPAIPKVHIGEAQSVPDANLHNDTGDRKLPAHAAMHPDIMASVPAAIDNTTA